MLANIDNSMIIKIAINLGEKDMRKSKIIATVLAVQMLGTIVTGCQTDSKDSNSLNKVKSQIESDVGGDEESDIQNIQIKLNESYNFFESVSKKLIKAK